MAIKKYRHTNLHLAASFILAVFGVGLTAFGELLTFCAALAGLDYHSGKVSNNKNEES